jgi:hypothetical protein
VESAPIRVGAGNGEDLLIAGTTSFDFFNSFNDVALLSVLNEWSSNRAYAQRVANIMGTGSGTAFEQRLNGNISLTKATATSGTVRDDNNSDTLKGGSKDDFFFANVALGLPDIATNLDVISGRKNGESVIDIDVPQPIEHEGDVKLQMRQMR